VVLLAAGASLAYSAADSTTTAQRVTVRGEDAVVVLSAAEYARLAPAASKTTLAALFADSPFSRLHDFEKTLVRERAPSRDLPEF
jgi:hypothetical protein